MPTCARLGGLVCLAAMVLACESYPSVMRGDGPFGDAGSTGTGASPATGGSSVIVNGGGETSTGGSTSEAECGNGALEPGELCDDGGTVDDDGCSGDCEAIHTDYVCLDPGEPCIRQVVCGNGRLEGNEACDDGNSDGEDGCATDCGSVDEGWQCPRPGRPCVELPVCGNGARERGESCDDGNAAAGDGCTGTSDPAVAGCEVEDGFWCALPGDPCVALRCGDGSRTPDELCDDGNTDPGDGCSATCSVEDGWRCSQSGCSPLCGDGSVIGAEGCDDGDRAGGDGCSAACVEEPFHDCSGAPSVCASSIECGDGSVDPGEICDPPGQDGCFTDCRSFAPDVADPPVCGNSLIEINESCDPPAVGAGCTTSCQAEPGFVCPRPNTCFRLPECGDGVVQPGEECDVGVTSSPGCVSCAVQAGWLCFGVEPSVCEQPMCGDGARSPSEECDDTDTAAGDGCSPLCEVEDGWVCPEAGEACLPLCGDSLLTQDEECDDGNRTNRDGCNAACRVEPGYTCPDLGQACLPATCGDGTPELGEGCDDGNLIAGDGCGPTCQLEPSITVGPNPVVAVTCGDGLVTGTEGCDDGNTSPGDGCGATCTVEQGYECEDLLSYPPYIDFAVTYRDFKRDVDDGGHPDFEWEPNPFRRGIPGPVCTTTNTTACAAAPGAVCPAGTCGVLDAEGKPAFHLTGTASQRGRVTSAESYSLWYRNTNAAGIEGANGVIDMWNVRDSLRLTQEGGAASDVYRFDSTSHFPLTGRGFGNTPGETRNYHFTTELRYYFQYGGGETLSFRGDDDVWVFINGRHAVDIGGVHGVLWGRVVLGDDGDGAATDSDCSAHGANNEPAACSLEAEELASDDDQRFGLTRGGVYEIVLFHAERHTSASNFRLTLQGFLAPRSSCTPICGDGQLVGYEVCDDGEQNSDTEYGVCNTTCTGRSFCGDAVRQGATDSPSGPEQCDNGRNLDMRATGAAGECAPGCVLPPTCGDGIVQAGFEQCDDGEANDDLAYGPTACKADCTLGAFCGDGAVNGPEVCDLGADNGREYGAGSCGYDCRPGPRCGDGIRNGPEECDGSEFCRADCTLEPFCGDGVVSAGEACDYGRFASSSYGSCTDACEWGPLCGDGQLDAPFEECDLGSELNLGEYDGCTASCLDGPRCGDGVRQANSGEQCDNGYNDDVYAYTDSSCGPGCERPPHCGDGVVEPGFELCDDGAGNSDTAYNGCSTRCDWGPYCGDGSVDPGEACDAGLDNTLYASARGACGPDCAAAPYCGDGVRNGPEQCDAGTDDNTGAYGGCNQDCTRAPYCGDGVVQAAEGEACDAGPRGSLSCTPGCERREEVR